MKSQMYKCLTPLPARSRSSAILWKLEPEESRAGVTSVIPTLWEVLIGIARKKDSMFK